jgi:hypothetical protein
MHKSEYMACKENTEKAHQEYYGQYVTVEIKATVGQYFGIETLKSAYKKDDKFNTIELIRWDMLHGWIQSNSLILEKMKNNGDFLSMAGSVCILKEAARQLVSE